MIESRLDAAQDGAGPYSKRVEGKKVQEIASLFRDFSSHREPYAALAVLRIVGEQSRARDSALATPWQTVPLALATTIPLVLIVTNSSRPVGQYSVVVLGLVVFDLVLSVKLWADLSGRSRFRAQLDETRRLGLEAIDAITSNGSLSPVQLDDEQRATWKKLRRVDPVVWERLSRVLR